MTDFISIRLFPEILNMSLTGSIVILTVLVIRFFLRKAPKKWSYLLWLVVAFRLVCPVSLPSPISLLGAVNAPVTTEGTIKYIPQTVVRPQPVVLSATPSTLAPSTPNAVTPDAITPAPQLPTASEPVSVTDILPVIWLIGMAALLVYSVMSYLRLRRRLAEAILYHDNVWQSDRVQSPFILGFFRPRIYIPFGLDEQTLNYVLAHERCHLKRNDHVIKPLAFLLLAVHWFNPLCWLAFHLMGRDMEMSCDEQVLAQENGDRKVYSTALLSFASNRRFPAPSPLAFGEGEVRPRITNALNWKAPKVWVTAAAGVLCVVVLLLCALNPLANRLSDPFGYEYRVVKQLYAAVDNPDAPPHFLNFTFHLSKDRELSVTANGLTTQAVLSKVAKPTPEEFDHVFNHEQYWARGYDATLLRENNHTTWHFTYHSGAYRSISFLLLQQKDDSLYLAFDYSDQPLYSSSPLPNHYHCVLKLERSDLASSGRYADLQEHIDFLLNPIVGTTIGTTLVTVTDTKVETLKKVGELADLSPNGVLEAWEFSYLFALDGDPETIAAGLSEGQYEIDGWYKIISNDFLIVLRYEDGSCDVLGYGNDNMDFPGTRSYEDALRDWYAKEYNVAVSSPLESLLDWYTKEFGVLLSAPTRIGHYTSIEDYVTATLAKKTQQHLSDLDSGTLIVPVTDRRITLLKKSGELSGLAPEGTLELWGYEYALKLDVDPERVLLAGGGNVTEDGWFALDYPHNVVALLDADGYYTILHDESNNDGMDFWGGRTPEEAIYDWYVNAYNLTDVHPPYIVNWRDLSYTSDRLARRYDGGNVWYIYIPLDTWLPSSGTGNWLSAYGTGAGFSVMDSMGSLTEELRMAQAEGWTVTNEGRCYRIDRENNSLFVYPWSGLDGERVMIVYVYWPDAPSQDPYDPSPEQEKEELFKIARSFAFRDTAPTSPETLHTAAEEAATAWLLDLTATDTVIGVTVHRAEYDEEMTRNIMREPETEDTYACVRVEYSVCCDDAHPVAFSFSHPFRDGSGRYTGLMSLTRDSVTDPWQHSSMPSAETLDLFRSVPPSEGEWTRIRGSTPEDAVRSTLDAETQKSFVSTLTVDSIELDPILTRENAKCLKNSELAQLMGWNEQYLDTSYAAVMAQYTILHKEPWNRMDGTYRTLFHLIRDKSSSTWILMEPLSTRSITIQDNPELEQTLTDIIREHYAPENPDGLYHTQSYTVVDTLDYKRTDNDWTGWYRHLYTVVLNQTYDLSGATPRLVSESHSMDMITVTYTEADHYKLVSYRTPTQEEFEPDSFAHSTHVSDKGVYAAGNLSQYYPEQSQLCYEKALTYRNSLP